MEVKQRTNTAYLLGFLKWALLGLVMGGLGGLLGAGFHYALHFVTDIQLHSPWLVWLLPLLWYV